MTSVKNLAKTQVSLDRCTGEFAIKLRAASISMENSYRRVEAYRAAALAACAPVVTCPEALQVLEGALTAEASIEKIVQVYWNEQKMKWNLELANHCDLGFTAQASEFPDFPYEIVTPEKGLAVDEGTRGLARKPIPIFLRIQKRSLVSEASVSRNTNFSWLIRWSG